MLHYYLCVRIFKPANMIHYVCKCDSVICTYKSVNAGFLYVKTGKKKNKSTEKVIEVNKPMNTNYLNNLKDRKRQQ